MATTSETFIRMTHHGARNVLTTRGAGAYESVLKDAGCSLARATHQTLDEADRWTREVLGLVEDEEREAGEETRDTERVPANRAGRCGMSRQGAVKNRFSPGQSRLSFAAAYHPLSKSGQHACFCSVCNSDQTGAGVKVTADGSSKFHWICSACAAGVHDAARRGVS